MRLPSSVAQLLANKREQCGVLREVPCPARDEEDKAEMAYGHPLFIKGTPKMKVHTFSQFIVLRCSGF